MSTWNTHESVLQQDHTTMDDDAIAKAWLRQQDQLEGQLRLTDLHELQHQHGLAIPWTCAIKLDYVPVKAERLQDLDLL